MPVYEFQGKHYDLSETDPVAAKARIESYLDKTGQEAVPPKAATEGFGEGLKAPPVAKPTEPVKTPTPSRPSAALTDVLNRGLVAGVLGTPVDIASLPFQIGAKVAGKEFPEVPFGSEYIGRKMEQAGMVSPTRRPLGEFAAGMAAPVAGAVVGVGKAGVGLVRQAIGKETKAASEAAKRSAVQQYEPAISEAQRKAEQAGRVISQMERQPVVAAERAATAPLTTAQQQAALQAEIRKPVRERAAGMRVTTEEEAARAAAAASQAEQTAIQAKQAVDFLEQQLLLRPTTTAEQFGSQLRDTVKTLQKNLIAARSEGSNLGQVISAAGDSPTVNTAALVAETQSLAKKTRNPQVLGMLSEIESLAKTGDVPALTLQQADSLRKYLNKDILAKFFAQTGADKETLKTLRTLRGSLIESTPQNYREALGEFATLSRPLDIVERQGALKRVVDVDPMSTAERLTEAKVVGEIITKAKAGNPVFTRLLETNPGLKDSGRLYFTQDLFAKGAVPTQESLRTWLKNNERPLRQLGLYDEFKDIRIARETAQRAVEETRLAESAAKKVATVAEKERAAATKLSKESQSRLEEALKTKMGPPITSGKPAPIQTFITTRDQQTQAAQSLTKMRDDISMAKTPDEIKSAIKKASDDLYKRGLIDDAGRRTMLRDVENLQSMIDAQTKARKIIGYFAGIAGITYGGRRAAETLF
jgi:hypothetical protein